MHWYSSVLSGTSSLNHPIFPKTYGSFLASLSSLPPRISQFIFLTIIFPISSTLLPSIQWIPQNSDPKAIQVFASQNPLLLSVIGNHKILKSWCRWLWPQWSPSVLPTFSFSLSPQWLSKIPFSSNILHNSLFSYPPYCPTTTTLTPSSFSAYSLASYLREKNLCQ